MRQRFVRRRHPGYGERCLQPPGLGALPVSLQLRRGERRVRTRSPVPGREQLFVLIRPLRRDGDSKLSQWRHPEFIFDDLPAPPFCSQGTFDSVLSECTAAIGCPSGYTYNSSLSRCDDSPPVRMEARTIRRSRSALLPPSATAPRAALTTVRRPFVKRRPLPTVRPARWMRETGFATQAQPVRGRGP